MPERTLWYFLKAFKEILRLNCAILTVESNTIFNIKRIEVTYFGTIRAILDSKYNEFLITDDYSQITPFGDFVYSWISNY